MSIVRGPQRSIRSRFMPRSISRQMSSKVSGGSDVLIAAQALKRTPGPFSPRRRAVEFRHRDDAAIGALVEGLQGRGHRSDRIGNIAAKTEHCGGEISLRQSARCSLERSRERPGQVRSACGRSP